MTSRLAACILVLAGFFLFVKPVAADELLTFVYLGRENDPAYVERKSYTGLKLREVKPPVEGARAGIKDARIPGRAAGLAFELAEIQLDPTANVADAINSRLAIDRNSVFLLDLPEADVFELAHIFKDRSDIVLFNIRHATDRLRAEDCSAAMFHTIPSQSMLTDALAQYLVGMNWRHVLLLASESETDSTLADKFEQSARKFGLQIAGRRLFVTSNDPRQRELNNARLLTADADFDVIFVADNEGEFGRYLEYRSMLPRPVIGSEGLMASAWHWTWERNGAPQLNQRIRKLTQANPSPLDWAAWVAVKSAVSGAIATHSVEPKAIREMLIAADLEIDMYKVGPGSFRPWDHQLRQPILLHTYNAVITTAPIEGFAHQFNTFDTLGFDKPENRCSLR
jgi:ABC transporter substrate binding protein (PQQ-dependent alcohol dehydrogenase system)